MCVPEVGVVIHVVQRSFEEPGCRSFRIQTTKDESVCGNMQRVPLRPTRETINRQL